jgi:hypothetical protein
MTLPLDRSQLVSTLRRQLARQEGLHLPRDSRPVSTGVAALDELLPWGGLRPGSLVEYLPAEEAGGTDVLALLAAREACREGRAVVVLDRERRFYFPAARAWGMDGAQTVLLRPANTADELWALDQALRSPGIGAVWARCQALPARECRRLQLAAESGGTLGLLIRPARARGRPTWADVQWLVEPQPSRGAWRLRVELVRCRGAAAGQAVLLELDETSGIWRTAHDDSPENFTTHPLPALAPLADPAAGRRRSRA